MHRLHNDLELRLHILVISPAALFVDHTVHAVRYKVPVVSYVHHYVIDLLWGPPERGGGVGRAAVNHRELSREQRAGEPVTYPTAYTALLCHNNYS